MLVEEPRVPAVAHRHHHGEAEQRHQRPESHLDGQQQNQSDDRADQSDEHRLGGTDQFPGGDVALYEADHRRHTRVGHQFSGEDGPDRHDPAAWMGDGQVPELGYHRVRYGRGGGEQREVEEVFGGVAGAPGVDDSAGGESRGENTQRSEQEEGEQQRDLDQRHQHALPADLEMQHDRLTGEEADEEDDHQPPGAEPVVRGLCRAQAVGDDGVGGGNGEYCRDQDEPDRDQPRIQDRPAGGGECRRHGIRSLPLGMTQC